MIEKITMNNLQMFEHRRGIAWKCSFYFEGRKIFNAENEGIGGMTCIDGIDALLTVKIREMCECLTGSVWGLEDIVDLTDSEESLARGLQKLQSIGGQHGKENHYSC